MKKKFCRLNKWFSLKAFLVSPVTHQFQFLLVSLSPTCLRFRSITPFLSLTLSLSLDNKVTSVTLHVTANATLLTPASLNRRTGADLWLSHLSPAVSSVGRWDTMPLSELQASIKGRLMPWLPGTCQVVHCSIVFEGSVWEIKNDGLLCSQVLVCSCHEMGKV